MSTSTDPSQSDLQLTPNSRPKRRTAKVDYTEKKDYDFDLPTGSDPSKALRETSLETPEPNTANGAKQGKRKYVRKNAQLGPGSEANTRPDTPIQNEDINDGGFPWNYQPVIENPIFSHILDLNGATVKDGIELQLADGSKLCKDDNIYLICEPPGEPYYIGRIMGFVKNKQHGHDDFENDSKIKTRNGKSIIEPAEGYRFKINWYYRSRDISKHSNDSRLLYASMHSDTCPLQSFRGKCVVQHKDEIEDFELYKTIPNQFWFDKLFDRYMIRFYEVLPTSQLTSLPINYYTALMKRFPYIFVEQGKSKDMLQSPKSCAKCNQWCNHSDSIECCECHEMYHMLCLDPPLYKKPARGFAWSCIRCTKKLEGQKLIPSNEINNEDDGTQVKITNQTHEKKLPSYEEAAIIFLRNDSDLEQQDRRNQEEWVYRYLGMHAKLEDALDLQDRPYPRAASRLGPKNQLTGIQDWYGHVVEYYDNSELNEEYQKTTVSKKKKIDGRRKQGKISSEEPEEEQPPLKLPDEYKDTDPADLPPWLQERPKGYIERGGEDTATLQWKMPEESDKADKLDEYIKNAAPIAESLDLLPNTPNFMDQILKNLLVSNYDFAKAEGLNKLITRDNLKEPTFTSEEIKKFEDGVKEFGSELFPVAQKVKTQPVSMIVRFYYLWKKTKNGHLIWDNYEGRKKTKNNSKVNEEENETQNLGHSADDSSYDTKKSPKKPFQCKHCKTNESMIWFRSPGAVIPNDDKITALCIRCARLWRRYAVIWEEPNEVLRKTGQKGGYGWKKKLESELMVDCDLILKARADFMASNNGDFSKKRKQSSVEPISGNTSTNNDTPVNEPVKKSKIETKSISPSPEKKSSIIDKKATKEKRPYNKKQLESPKDEKPEILVSNILSENLHINLQQAMVERYYHSTSSIYNSKLKFHEFPNQRSPLIAQSSSKLIKPIMNSKKCAVCLEDTEPNTSLFCYGCSINIHPQCYGVDCEDVKQPYGSYKWYCDPCSNSLNPLISSNYKCCLCGMYNEDEFIKAGLKRTNDGKWVHVLCALLNPHVKLFESGILQPAYGIQNAIAHKFKEGRHPRLCDICDESITLKEAQQATSKVRVGFKVVAENKPDSKCIKAGNIFGKLSPIVLCGKHDIPSLNFEFLSFTAEVKRYKQSNAGTAIHVYIEDFKKPAINGLTGTQGRFVECQDALKTLQQSKGANDVNGGHVGDDYDHDGVKSADKCQTCGVSKTLKWIETTSGKRCYNCYLKQDEDVEMKDADDTTEEDENIYEKIVEVSNGGLYGEHYGIVDFNDHVSKPAKADEPQYYEFQQASQHEQPQQLPFRNGTVSEYRYYPPPPAESEDATPIQSVSRSLSESDSIAPRPINTAPPVLRSQQEPPRSVKSDEIDSPLSTLPSTEGSKSSKPLSSIPKIFGSGGTDSPLSTLGSSEGLKSDVKPLVQSVAIKSALSDQTDSSLSTAPSIPIIKSKVIASVDKDLSTLASGERGFNQPPTTSGSNGTDSSLSTAPSDPKTGVSEQTDSSLSTLDSNKTATSNSSIQPIPKTSGSTESSLSTAPSDPNMPKALNSGDDGSLGTLPSVANQSNPSLTAAKIEQEELNKHSIQSIMNNEEPKKSNDEVKKEHIDNERMSINSILG